MNGHEENVATLRGQEPPDKFRDQQLFRARLARLTKTAGGFTPEDVGGPTRTERIIGEFGRGMLNALTLGHADISRDEVLDLAPGDIDASDIAGVVGHIVGMAPAALATSAVAGLGAAALAGRAAMAGRAALAAGQVNKARALARAADVLGFLSQRAPEEAGLLARAFRSSAQNIYAGLAYSLSTEPFRHIDEGISRARSIAINTGFGAAVDFLLGAALPFVGAPISSLVKKLANSDNSIDRELAEAVMDHLRNAGRVGEAPEPGAEALRGADIAAASRRRAQEDIDRALTPRLPEPEGPAGLLPEPRPEGPVRIAGHMGTTTRRPDEIRVAGPRTTPDPLALPERAGELPERMQPEVPERVAPGFVGREALPEWVRASNRILELAARGPIYPDMISPAERPLYQRLVLSGLLDEAPDGTFRLTDIGESVLAVRRARQAGTAPTRIIPPERRLPARTEGSPIITPPPPGSVLPPERVDIIDPELLAAERTPGAGRPRPRPAEAGPEAPPAVPAQPRPPRGPAAPEARAPEVEALRGEEPGAPPTRPEQETGALTPEERAGLRSRDAKDLAHAIERAANRDELIAAASNIVSSKATAAEKEILSRFVQRRLEAMGGLPRPRAEIETLRGPGPGEEPPPTGGAPAPRPRPQGPPPGTPGRRARPRTPEEQAERDVTARRLREERRRRIEAEQNRVTGLPGRQPFERARPRIEADPKGRIGLVDVNNFKAVNDRRGMEAGDEMLRRVAEALKRAAREIMGTERGVFHFGGDEFAVIGQGSKVSMVLRRAQEIFGTHDIDGFEVSLRTSEGRTFAEADAAGRARKAADIAAGKRKYRDVVSPREGARPRAEEEAAVATLRGEEPEPGPAALRGEEAPRTRPSEPAGGEAPAAGGEADPLDAIRRHRPTREALREFGDDEALMPSPEQSAIEQIGRLRGLREIEEALQTGVHPETNRRLTQRQRKEFEEARRELRDEIESVYDEYERIFGPENADEFRRITQEQAGGARQTEAPAPEPERPTLAEQAEARRTAQSREAPMGEEVRGAQGAADEAVFPDGRTVRVRYELVPVEDVVPSHNAQTFQPDPRYPEGVQGRDYTTDRAAQDNIAGAAAKFDERLVLDTTRAVDHGPPMVRPDGVAIAGNARAMIVQRVADAGGEAWESYVTRLRNEAHKFGLTPSEVAARMADRPHMLVRKVVDDSIDLTDRSTLAELNRISDIEAKKTKTPLDEAAGRARRMREAGRALDHFAETFNPNTTLRQYLRTREGRQFLELLRNDGVISQQETARFLAGQEPTQEGVELIENMLYVTALGGDKELVRQALDPETGVRAILQQLEYAVPAIVRSAQHEGWDLSPALADAIRLHLALRRTPGAKTIDDLLAQGSLFEPTAVGQQGTFSPQLEGGLFTRPESPHGIEMARFLKDANKKQTSEAFRGFAEDARKRVHAERDADLFGNLPRGPEESFAYWFGGESGFGRLVRQGAWLDALERAARAADGHKEAEVRLGWGPRKALLEVLGPLAKEDMTNLQLVQMARQAGLFNDAIMEAARRAYMISGFAALRPIAGGAIGGLVGGTAGAAIDEEDRTRGFATGAGIGFVLGAGLGAARARRAALRDLDPRIQVEELPKRLGFFEKWIGSPTDVFRRLDPNAGRIAELGAEARDNLTRFLDDRRQRVEAIWKPLTREDRATLWRLLDKYPVVGDLPRDVPEHLRQSFQQMRELFRDDVLRLFEMRRGLLRPERRRVLDYALEHYNSLKQLPEDLDNTPINAEEILESAREWGIRLERPPATAAGWRRLVGQIKRKMRARERLIAKGEADAGPMPPVPEAAMFMDESLAALMAMRTGEWGIAAYWPHVFQGEWHVRAGAKSNWFQTRNEAIDYAQKLLRDGEWKDDIEIVREFVHTEEMAHLLPRSQYWRFVADLRNALGLDDKTVIKATGRVVQPEPRRKFNPHARPRKVNLQTFEEDPLKALQLYYWRWGSKLAFDPFRVKSAELLERVNPRIDGLREEVEDYILRVQGIPGPSEKALDATFEALARLAGVDLKPFFTRRAAAKILGFQAFSKLGWNPVSAAVNLTQTVVNTVPVIGERWTWEGVRLMGLRAAGKLPDEYEKALRDGGVLLLHAKHLPGELRPKDAEKMWTPMYLFGRAEDVNRGIAFLGAFERAKRAGRTYEEAVREAREVTRKTQFRYDAADAPRIVENPVGRVLFQFKTFMLKELEFLYRLAEESPAKAAKALAYLTALGGMRALLIGTPLATLDWLVGQLGLIKEKSSEEIAPEDWPRQGVNLRPSEWLTRHAPDWSVFGLMSMIARGDLSERIGIGTAREFTDPFGPTVSNIKDFVDAVKAWREGHTERAERLMERLLPVFAKRFIDANRIWETGEVRDTWGRTLREAEPTEGTKAVFGIRPFEATRERERETIRRRFEAQVEAAGNRVREQMLEAFEAGDLNEVQRLAEDAASRGIFIDPEGFRRSIIERRMPDVRAFRRTRLPSRAELLETGILRTPEPRLFGPLRQQTGPSQVEQLMGLPAGTATGGATLSSSSQAPAPRPPRTSDRERMSQEDYLRFIRDLADQAEADPGFWQFFKENHRDQQTIRDVEQLLEDRRRAEAGALR